MAVTRADIESKVNELVTLLSKFHGWDQSKDTPMSGVKALDLTDEIKLCVIVTASRRGILITSRET